ncbi:MAG: cell division/cell wall cluster transcriptional repressor MraZ [bacterium]|nr:cell division/cell wall cluster transcriptional repressor MraZ [bacterium]
MFLGTTKRTVDEKGRLLLPKPFRGELAPSCVITKGQDGHLVIYSQDGWNQRAVEVREGYSRETASGRRFRRLMFFGAANQQSMDSQGRLMVASELREHAGIQCGGEVVVVGVDQEIEVWSAPAFQRHLKAAEYASADREER